MNIFDELKNFIKEQDKIHNEKYKNEFNTEGKNDMADSDNIIKILNIIRNNQASIYKEILNIKYKMCAGGKGVVLKDKLPWSVSSKEVYMLSKQYSIDEVQFITGYNKDDIMKKIKQHTDNNI